MKVNPSSSESIDGYIAGFPEAVQHVLERVRAVIQAVAPDAQEAIKYRLPTFLLNGNLVHFKVDPICKTKKRSPSTPFFPA